ncbi:MAG: NAD-dependent DNA ligase LigA, partial [Verrucomicrobiaceae bacterium]
FGLGIRYVGETVAKKLAYGLGNIDALQQASAETLTTIDEIGIRIAESVVEYFQYPQHIQQINVLKNAGLQFEVVVKERVLASESLAGRSFVISGVFADHSRDELKELIETNGGKILSGISAKLDFLVAGDNMGPAKLEKATKLKIPIISEQELLDMINLEE